MTLPKRFLVALCLFVVWALLWKYFEENLGSQLRVFVDTWDLRTYYNDGRWFPMDARPYIDVPSEYPQVARISLGGCTGSHEMLFARIYSPQWILWVLPSLILVSRGPFDDVLIVLYGIFTYVGFPLVYDAGSSLLPFVSLLNLFLLLVLVIRSALRLDWKFAYDFLPRTSS